MISAQLSGLISFFPWNLIIALFLAFTFAVVGIAIFRHSIKKSEEESLPKEPHPFLEKWKTSFAQFGFFATNAFSKSFVHALNIMRSFIGGRQFRYQLPWIVMVGAKESGKSTILQSFDLDKPIGRPHFSDEGGDQPLCDWFFYDHGIVLDLDGKIVLNASQPTSDEENWQLFLNLLAHHRPKRPLDGVVLTIPASEMMGQTALSHDDIMIRAEYLYGKLWNMQRVTGIRVPVYIVVTKCDLVPGFESICKSIPTHNKNDIFGWSNDEAVDAIYNPDWIDKAFSSINESLYKIQQEIYANGKAIDSRNGVFMFPLSFNTLKGGIQTYANHLFKESSYHESFFLRGIYFVGDSHLDRTLPLSNASLNLRREGEPLRRNIYFAEDTFESKIFREMGLARPISRVLLGNTRSMRFAKAIVAMAVILGTLGLLRANEVLQRSKVNLSPALTQIEQTLATIRGQSESTEKGRFVFEDQARVLLDTMTKISVNHLSSVFIPASWFDPIDKKIRYVMSLAYDQVIIRAMARELDNIALLTTSLYTLIPVTEAPVNGVDPLKSLEFYHLRNYVFAIKQLENIANKFNNFSNYTSLEDVAEIIKYLFNYEPPQSFYENDDYYIEATEKLELSMFDFSKYQGQATIKLSKLFAEFQLAAFDPNRIIPGLEKLQTSMGHFSGTKNYAAYDVDLLRDIFLSLQQTINSIENPGLNWLDESSFDPGLPYEDIKKIVYNSQFFNTNTKQGLIIETDKKFLNFRKILLGYKSPLFSGESIFKEEDGLAVSTPSRSAINLEKSLESFFSEPFMAPTTDKAIVINVPIGSVLLWDTLRLQEGTHLINEYNKFINSRFLSLPKALQPILQRVAREGLTENLVSFIANAQIFNSDIVTESRLAPEDALLPQVQNYRAAAPYLEQLLFALRTNNANTAFSALKNVLTAQVYGIVTKLDHILTDEAPYAIKLNSFSWWNGKNMAALEAFSVLNLNELKHYLELQRDRINYLAREFAGPLVAFLEKINMEGMPGNLPLLSKWEGIINELNEYDRKTPGNGLVELENFIMYPLNEVTIETCNKYANVYNMLSPAEDYFLNILVNIQKKLHEQCVALSSVVSVNYYEKLSQFFNANLAGKFPFVEKVDNNTPDANPEDIRTFFEMMDTQAVGLKASLKEATSLGAPGKKAQTFIEQMEKVRQFFGGYLEPNSTLPNPAFSFEATFRVNREKEAYANEILDWELTAQDTTVTMRSPTHVGYWEAGNPLKVVFRWALNSPLQPMIVEGMPNFDVQGENAIFSYDGIWPLLRLLKQHQATSSDFASLNDDNPTTLRFDIPLTNVLSQDRTVCMNELRKATVFIRLKISPLAMVPPKKVPLPTKGAAPTTAQEKITIGAPVNLPYFPSHAPRLDNSGASL
jgi:type VI secretion system protein ImpL